MLDVSRWGSLHARYDNDRPHRLLALDGGGIRGLITLGILERLEELVKARGHGALHEYFDYIAGTSTGASIAAGLARGMSVGELITFYEAHGAAMFSPSWLWQWGKYFYSAGPLASQLKTVFGATTTLQPQHLRCLLMIVTKNVTTGSPWPISSNPDAKYNDLSRGDCNLRIPLWQLVRASTAAPAFFRPEIVACDPTDPSKTFVFVDGGITPYNNPAFLLYRMATEPAYRLNWRAGERELLLVSVGTGAAEQAGVTAAAPNRNLFSIVTGLPAEFMYGMQVDQDVSCRTVGRCTFGAALDREIGNLVPSHPLTVSLGRRFLYVRYNADLSEASLMRMEFPNLTSERIQKMDAVENIRALLAIGRIAGREQVSLTHLGPFV